MFTVRRSSHNPILLPARERSWEAYATFNWSPIIKDDTLHCLYRAQSLFEPIRGGSEHFSMSIIGRAESTDGIHFSNRAPFIKPSEEWDQYGCEDPRVTYFEGNYYTFYTALSHFPFNKEGIKVAVAVSSDLKTVDEKHLVTPFNAKAMALFPERIHGKITVIVNANTDDPPSHIALFQCDNIEDLWNEDLWNTWYENISEHTIEDPQRSEQDHIEVGAVPIKTEYGWLLIYSYIEDYFLGNERRFGVEALLLDTENPQTIVGRTEHAMFSAEEHYERYGHVPDVSFPSGALVYGDMLDIYYGAADTACARASVNLENLLTAMRPEARENIIVRFENNPILKPLKENAWESRLVFNPAAIDIDGSVSILYRAMGEDNTSVIGLAKSRDGVHISTRYKKPIYVPREPFEEKRTQGNSGCEDPRIVRIADRLYMTYTAYDGVNVPRIAATSISVDEFKNRKWSKWTKPKLISHPNIMDKDSCVIPQKYDEGYLILHRLETNVCGDFVKDLSFDTQLVKCIQILQNRRGMWDGTKVGIAGPPLKTDKGWLLFYHGVGYDNVYRVGAALLDLYNPTNVIGRTSAPLLEPREPYEKEGEVPNVVFPCGAVEREGTIYMYYGGADAVVCGVRMKTEDVLKMFE